MLPARFAMLTCAVTVSLAGCVSDWDPPASEVNEPLDEPGSARQWMPYLLDVHISSMDQSHTNEERVAMLRSSCKYQDFDGGRWLLPTTAEVVAAVTARILPRGDYVTEEEGGSLSSGWHDLACVRR